MHLLYCITPNTNDLYPCLDSIDFTLGYYVCVFTQELQKFRQTSLRMKQCFPSNCCQTWVCQIVLSDLARQCSKRGGDIHLELDGSRVHIVGQATCVMEATLLLWVWTKKSVVWPLLTVDSYFSFMHGNAVIYQRQRQKLLSSVATLMQFCAYRTRSIYQLTFSQTRLDPNKVRIKFLG